MNLNKQTNKNMDQSLQKTEAKKEKFTCKEIVKGEKLKMLDGICFHIKIRSDSSAEMEV